MFVKYFFNKKSILPVLIFLFFYSCSSTPEQKGTYSSDDDNYTIIIENASKKLKEVPQESRPLRLAVLGFVSTSKEGTDENEFGNYYSESLISALKKGEEKYKLFERSRLNVILEENSLNLSGLIDQDQAKKIGELAPIDALLSGTYTKLKDHIDINSRLVDVVTGEILLTFSGRINVTPDIERLFEGRRDDMAGFDVCAGKKKKIDELLSDLSSEEKINNLVAEAVMIPYDKVCGKIHFSVMYAFKKYKINDQKYKKFLMDSVSEIEFPSQDGRANAVLKFLASDGKVDESEWALGLEVIKKSEKRDISSSLSALLKQEYYPEDLVLMKKRVDQYFILIKTGKAGLPVPVGFNDGFSEMIDSQNYIYNNDNRILIYCYSKYHKDLDLDEMTVKKVNTLLTRMYLREEEQKAKQKILGWICDFYNKRKPDKELGDDMFDFVRQFEVTSYKEKNPEELLKTPKNHLKSFIEKCQGQFCKTLPMTEFKNQKEDRIDFCLENNVNCPGFAPTANECIKMLDSDNWNERIRAMEVLVKMGEGAKKAESAVLKVLKAKKLRNETQASIVYKNAMIVLGNIRTSDPKALSILMDSLGSLYSYVPQNAMEALAKIGKPAVPYLIKGLSSKFGSVQFKSAKALGMIGPPAKSAGPALKKLLQSDNSAVHQVVKEALEEIGQ